MIKKDRERTDIRVRLQELLKSTPEVVEKVENNGEDFSFQYEILFFFFFSAIYIVHPQLESLVRK